jgi:eukaryotic-like serine/threonine-protein kinase
MVEDLQEELLKLAVERGLILPEDLPQPPHPSNLIATLLEQGKLTSENLEALKAELQAAQMPTMGDPWKPLEESAIDASDKEISINVFGRYIQLRLIGQGGIARVYCGYDPTLGRSVALKILRDESNRLMFEARSLARVEHENVCKVYEAGQVEGKQYISMQYIAGKTLGDAEKEMTLDEKLEVIRKIAEAVHFAHKQGLVHRDIKPSNIMLEKTESGIWKPYILDFGLARMQAAPGITQQGAIVGTPHYMSPEQARSENVDARGDIYSLGATLYELITGETPFSGSTSEIILKVIQDDVIPLRKIKREISIDLETIVMKCLEKEPAARYQSAKALANDLERYLEGEPISARPLNWTARLWKKAKKNRVAASILTIGLVVTLILISLLILSQWKGSVQTQYANDFAEEIRYIETLLLSTYTAPIHNVTPKLSIARQRLKLIERRTAEGGSWAYGPGNNALGQGYLMLKDYERAQTFLEKAWNSGYRSPSTAYALGKVKGILWRQALIDADRLTIRTLQEEAQRKADEQFRKPAIELLKNVGKYAETPAYVEALILLYEKKHQEAFEKSRVALERSSRPYEVLKLQGDIHFQIGQDAIARKDYDSALMSFQSAGDAYNHAAELARSDQDIYLADAERLTRASYIQYEKEVELTSLGNAIKACDKAILIYPDNERSYRYKSEAYLMKGISQMYSSGDPRPTFIQSIELARISAAKNPKIPEPHDDIATAYLRIAEYESNNSIDPRKSLKAVIEESEKGLQLHPDYAPAFLDLATANFYLGDYELSHGGNPLPFLQKTIETMKHKTFQRDDFAFNLLGLTYLDIGEYHLKRGEDPRPHFNQAIESYQSALKLMPKSFVAVCNMALAYQDIARYEMNHGINPIPTCETAIQQYNHALEINPTYPHAFHDRGSVYLLKAEHKIRVGEDPKEELQNALSSFHKALELNADLTLPYFSIGNAHYFSALYSFKSSKDPSSELQQARLSLNSYLKLDESFSVAFQARGMVEALAARWEMLNRRSPITYFDRAIADTKKSIQLNENELTTYRSLAEIYRRKAEWDLLRNQPAGISISDGMQAIQNAIKLSDSDPETVAIEGSLKLLVAQESKDVNNRQALAKEAHQLLINALTANSFLKHDYDTLLKQAETLQSQKYQQ